MAESASSMVGAERGSRVLTCLATKGVIKALTVNTSEVGYINIPQRFLGISTLCVKNAGRYDDEVKVLMGLLDLLAHGFQIVFQGIAAQGDQSFGEVRRDKSVGLRRITISCVYGLRGVRFSSCSLRRGRYRPPPITSERVQLCVENCS